jgi:hypothetical protein
MAKNILEQVNQLLYSFMMEQDCDDDLYKSWKEDIYQQRLLDLLSKPKRAKSAYLFFCQENRPILKEYNPDMNSSEVTRELGRLWSDLKVDKSRLQEYEGYLELSNQEKEKLGIPVKEKKVSTRAKSAYIFFCQANRQDIKDENPGIKSTEITSKLAELWKELKNDEDRADELAEYESLASKDKERVGQLPKIKKRKTAYNIFCDMNRPDIKQENPEMTGKEVIKQLSLLWKELKDDSERKTELEEYEKLSKNYVEIEDDEKPKKKTTKNTKKNVDKKEDKKIDNIFVDEKPKEEIEQVEVIIKKGGVVKGSNLKAYNNFRSKKMVEIQEENPDMTKIQIDKEIRNLWQKMSEDEKLEYN